MTTLHIGLVLAMMCGPAQTEQAWWLRIQYTPRDTLVEGLKVSKIDASLKLVSILDDSLVPAQMRSEPDFVTPTQNRCAYRWQEDLNRDGKQETVLVGVYEDKKGRLGRILLILSAGKKNKKRVLFSRKEEGDAGFHVLCPQKGTLYNTTCMECGQACYIRYKQKKFELFCEDHGL